MLFGAFTDSGVQDALEIKASKKPPWTAAEFDQSHTKWCHALIKCVAENRTPPLAITFGVAAKFLNVYIKAAFVVPSADEHASLIAVAHPPLDNLFLAEMKRKHRHIVGSGFPEQGWQSFEQNDYTKVIAMLRNVVQSGSDLWRLERDWTGLE